MAKAKKYYAVRVGRDGPGIYDSWEACKKQVQGAPRAVYKSFFTQEEAEAFVQGWEQGREPDPEEPWDGAVAYVDGSFDKGTGDFSCGAVLFWQGEEREFSQRFADPEMAAMHNVAGEIMGAWAAGRTAAGRPTSPAPSAMPPGVRRRRKP